jgi:hypothetical protein
MNSFFGLFQIKSCPSGAWGNHLVNSHPFFLSLNNGLDAIHCCLINKCQGKAGPKPDGITVFDLPLGDPFFVYKGSESGVVVRDKYLSPFFISGGKGNCQIEIS